MQVVSTHLAQAASPRRPKLDTSIDATQLPALPELWSATALILPLAAPERDAARAAAQQRSAKWEAVQAAQAQQTRHSDAAAAADTHHDRTRQRAHKDFRAELARADQQARAAARTLTPTARSQAPGQGSPAPAPPPPDAAASTSGSTTPGPDDAATTSPRGSLADAATNRAGAAALHGSDVPPTTPGRVAPGPATTNAAQAASSAAPPTVPLPALTPSPAGFTHAQQDSATKPAAPPTTDALRATASRAIEPTATDVRSRSGRVAGHAPSAASPAPAESADTRTNLERIVRCLRAQIEGNRARATLRLDPPALGSLRLALDLQQDALALRIEPNSVVAHELLSEHLDGLREQLERAGIRLERVEIAPPPQRSADAGREPPGTPPQSDHDNAADRPQHESAGHAHAGVTPKEAIGGDSDDGILDDAPMDGPAESGRPVPGCVNVLA